MAMGMDGTDVHTANHCGPLVDAGKAKRKYGVSQNPILSTTNKTHVQAAMQKARNFVAETMTLFFI